MSFFTKLKRRDVFRVGLPGRLSRVAVENVVTGPVAIYSNWIVCFFADKGPLPGGPFLYDWSIFGSGRKLAVHIT